MQGVEAFASIARAAIARGGWANSMPLFPRADFSRLPDLVTFTVDLEDHLPPGPGAPRFVHATHAILDFLDRGGWRATFFVVGEIAQRTPGLIREIARRGHEIGSHAHRHLPLRRMPPALFASETRDGRTLLQDLAAAPVLGFRAPLFGLTRDTLWAVPILEEAGFAYSSSVLPARAHRFGFPAAPCGPFWWPGARLLEIPCPVGRAGPIRAPCLGGLYLRLLPPWRLNQLLRSLPHDALWTYCHPYDFDLDEPYHRARDCNLLSSFMLWWGRPRLISRLAALLDGRSSLPLAERLNVLGRSAPVWTSEGADKMPRPLLRGGAAQSTV